MAYLSSYVKNMLSKHPCGDDFQRIRELCSEVVSIESSSPNIRTRTYNPFSFVLKHVRSGLNGEVYGEQRQADHKKRVKAARYDVIREAMVLVKKLDDDDDSQWLAEYMVDDVACNVPEVREIFENYLKSCR